MKQDAPKPTLSIIGCGRVGRALGRAWHAAGIFAIGEVLNRSLESAEHAVGFIGAGTAVEDFTRLRAADVYLIGAGDEQIAACCERLAQTGLLTTHSIVFHCSGALSSAVLQAAAAHGTSAASVHPIRSFADPAAVARDFAGTFCGMEGDARACEALTSAFTAIGARIVPIDAQSKVAYHAAAVFASNYLVTLLDAAVQTYGKAGVGPETALELMAPLVRHTVENVLRLGPAEALTGPIARGDMDTAIRQQRAIAEWNPVYGELYRALGNLTANLAGRPQPDFDRIGTEPDQRRGA